MSISLKGHTDTRWPAVTSSCDQSYSIYKQIVQIVELLEQIVNDHSDNDDWSSGAENLLNKIDYEFLCTLAAWHNILKDVNDVNDQLQEKTLTLLVTKLRASEMFCKRSVNLS